MVAPLAALPRLKFFAIEFQSATPRPDRIHPPPVLTRTVLPALTSFQFKGASEYLEDLVARIDGPQLDWILVFYLNQLVDFRVAQLSNFIDRSVGPKLTLFRHARVSFLSDEVTFTMYRHANRPYSGCDPATTSILCEDDWQVSHIAQVLSHLFATLSTVVHLELDGSLREDHRSEGTDDVQWQHLLRQFPTVQTLRVSLGARGARCSCPGRYRGGDGRRSVAIP